MVPRPTRPSILPNAGFPGVWLLVSASPRQADNVAVHGNKAPAPEYVRLERNVVVEIIGRPTLRRLWR